MKIRKKDRLVLDIYNNVNYKFDFNEVMLAKKLIYETYKYFNIYLPTSIELIFVSKNEIKTINKKERHINKITDVLSFPNIEFNKPANLNYKSKSNISSISSYDFITKTINLGSIVICTDVMEEQAIKYCHSVRREYAFLLVHSLLHLLGFDHKVDCTKCKMFDIQELILKKLKITK